MLHVCTTNYDQMLFSYWDMVQEEQADRKSDILRCMPLLKNKNLIKNSGHKSFKEGHHDAQWKLLIPVVTTNVDVFVQLNTTLILNTLFLCDS